MVDYMSSETQQRIVRKQTSALHEVRYTGMNSKEGDCSGIYVLSEWQGSRLYSIA